MKLSHVILHAVGIAEDPGKRAAATSPSGVELQRSPHWGEVRIWHLVEHPTCEACGGRDHREVHHRIPFHVRPELELDPNNLITLCEVGPGRMNCHLVLGHCGNWKLFNATVDADAVHFAAMLAKARR